VAARDLIELNDYMLDFNNELLQANNPTPRRVAFVALVVDPSKHTGADLSPAN
jgi:hypothetical protein